MRDRKFDNFVVGDVNRRAFLEARTFVDSFGEQQKNFVLLGPPGNGKTHLSCAIANELLNANPSLRVVHVSCRWVEASHDFTPADLVMLEVGHCCSNTADTIKQLNQRGTSVVVSSSDERARNLGHPLVDVPAPSDELIELYGRTRNSGGSSSVAIKSIRQLEVEILRQQSERELTN